MVVTLLAAASMMWVLAGPAVLSVDAAGAGDGAPAGRCGNDSDVSRSDGHHCCGCCPHHHQPPPPVPPPRKTPPPAQVRKSPPARTVIVARPHPTATPSPAPVATPAPQARPPVLAPPALAVPPPVAPAVIATSPVSIYVVTLATLLVAGAVAGAAIVFIRRSD